MVAVPLVLLSGLSSNYIVEQETLSKGEAIVSMVAADVAPVLATGDLIRLEVSLRQILADRQLIRIRVEDADGRTLSSAGDSSDPANLEYRSLITIDGNIAGELSLLMPVSTAAAELQRMNLGLVSLALLLSLFAAVLAARWGQTLATRLQVLSAKLSLEEGEPPQAAVEGEIEQLERAVAELPLELLRAPAAASASTANYRDASLLYIHLDSLSQHVETLDETSLLQHTELVRRLVSAAAQLYGGSMSVARQFGLVVSFSDSASTGSPAFRAASTAWLIMQTAREASGDQSLRIRLSQACGVTETGVGSSQDIYPDLYNQHLVDELAQLTLAQAGGVQLSEDRG